jgi:biotin carboxyl carrier protein
MKFEAMVDGQAAKFESDGARLRFEHDGAVAECDYSIVPLAPGSYSVLIGGRSYSAIAVNGSIRVNGREFSVDLFDPREMRCRKAGGMGEGRQNILAPMPGKVVRVLVNAGDSVEAGQGLVVVEAMKMQNEMKSPKAGKVAEVKTKADATVAAGEVLLVIE